MNYVQMKFPDEQWLTYESPDICALCNKPAVMAITKAVKYNVCYAGKKPVYAKLCLAHAMQQTIARTK